MLRIVEDHRTALESLCRRFAVQRLYVFGSAARGDFDPARSDLDFLVEFAPLPPRELARTYFGLLASLKELFQRDIDLLTPKAIRNPYLQRSVDETRQEVYAA